MSDKIDGNGNDNHHDDGNDLSAGKGVIRYIYIRIYLRFYTHEVHAYTTK